MSKCQNHELYSGGCSLECTRRVHLRPEPEDPAPSTGGDRLAKTACSNCLLHALLVQLLVPHNPDTTDGHISLAAPQGRHLSISQSQVLARALARALRVRVSPADRQGLCSSI